MIDLVLPTPCLSPFLNTFLLCLHNFYFSVVSYISSCFHPCSPTSQVIRPNYKCKYITPLISMTSYNSQGENDHFLEYMICRDNVVYTYSFSPVNTRSGNTYFNRENVCTSTAFNFNLSEPFSEKFWLHQELWFN